jgi:branched-chain amino acid transport system permease protein
LTVTRFDVWGWELHTSKDMYPLLIGIVVLMVVFVRRLNRSRFARAMFKLRQHPEGASAQGVNVAATRALAYVIAGTLAGVAGGLSAMWIQSVSPATYSQATNLNYLTAVVVAGPGSLVAVAELSAFLEGFRLFISSNGPIITYIGPIGLIVTLVLVPGGVAAQNRQMKRLVLKMLRPRRRSEPAPVVKAEAATPAGSQP